LLSKDKQSGNELSDGLRRFSLGRHTTEEDIDYVLAVLPDIIKEIPAFSLFEK